MIPGFSQAVCIMNKESLFGKNIDELIEVAGKAGLPAFTARQIADWLYRKRITSIDEMTNLPLKARKLLSENYGLGLNLPENLSVSSDGTRKYLFRVLNDRYIETAFIPGKDHDTLCVSTQAGCKMGCIFCMTGKQGFQGNLTACDILNQLKSLPEYESVHNIVYMGMGEPLDNLREVLKSIEILTSPWGFGWSPTRITVSTIGIKDKLGVFLEKCRANLAISLHSPFEKERLRLIPAQKKNPLSDILEIIRKADINSQRRVSFEYILFRGVNDSPAHVKELARILNKIRCRINLIRFHTVPGIDFESPSHEEVLKFRDELNRKGFIATIRASRGEDIKAACGLLSTLQLNKSGNL